MKKLVWIKKQAFPIKAFGNILNIKMYEESLILIDDNYFTVTDSIFSVFISSLQLYLRNNCTTASTSFSQ